MDFFSRSHPAVTLLSLGAVLWGAMLSSRPGILLLLFLAGWLTSLRLDSDALLSLSLKVLLPLLLLTVLLNGLFSPFGVTQLATLPWGRPLTLEALAAGLVSGLRFITILLWLSSWSRLLTSDRILWLFGRLLPSFAMVLTLSLRLVPLYFAQSRRIRLAQQGAMPAQAVNTEGSSSWRSRVSELGRRWRLASAAFSALLTWSLEHAVDTADTMRARGYGSGKRSSFTPWRLDQASLLTLLALVLTVAVWAVGTLLDPAAVYLHPVITLPGLNRFSLLAYTGCFFTALTPLLLDLYGGLRWTAAQSST